MTLPQPPKRLCINCKFYSGHLRQSCLKASSTNLVTGEVHYGNCVNMRYDDTRCGSRGEWFEPANWPTLGQLIKAFMKGGTK